ncbi:uncharacterized protein LOC131931930 [Physella acuta]|uniref:uncharacterized protein LOC131931930 n=1 Tax=Physella acuta TaxID=109671 RepID=UPI0027DDCC79|nr:uncharacterized protein LOC131931930 [Physella acuta]
MVEMGASSSSLLNGSAPQAAVGVRHISSTEGKLSYTIPESLRRSTCVFDYNQDGQAVFQIQKNGKLERQHVSENLPYNSTSVKSKSVQGSYYVVTLALKQQMDLNAHFK